MKLHYTIFILLLPFSLFSQEFSMDLLGDIKPRNIGPAGMSGRVTAIDAVWNKPDIIYAGTASGGVWKSVSGGTVWEPIFEKENTASIGALAIQQSNPSVIWVGTGEGNPRNSLNGGAGIYRSLDAGKNWQLMGLEKTRHIHRIVIHPQLPNTVYVGAIGSPWGAHSERGVYKTTDGGKSWKRILYSNDLSGAADLVMDPENPNKLFATLWEHKRHPWFFNSGGKGSGLFMTHDGGENWKKITEDDGLPQGNLGRIGIAIARSNPQTVYALIESKKNALYKSTDGGFKWQKVNDKKGIGNRPFYYSEIYVDPQNENRLYSIFTYVNVSEDGGRSFKQLMPAYNSSHGVHPDHHAWWMHPLNGNYMIDGNDGGLNISRDRGKSWRFIGNIPVAQFYHINVDNEYPYNVYGGMQDNGSWRGPAYVWREQGIRNAYWQEISFGDGFDVIPDPENSRYGWSMSQQGFVGRYDWQTGNNYLVRPVHPDPEMRLRFNWNSAINISPFNAKTLYFGSQFVHKSTDGGHTWDIISPDLTSNDPEKQKQFESGGLTLDATGAENYNSITVIEPSPLDQNLLWVGCDDGNVHISRDGGENWNSVSKNIKSMSEGSWIAQIKASNKNAGTAFLVANDYRRSNFEAFVYKTTNFGNTWQRLADSEDAKSYALCIIEDPKEENLLFMGTDDGLYISLNAGDNWQKWTHGYPTVPTRDLVVHPRENDLVIGTFGRAAWVLDDLQPLREIASTPALLQKPIKLFKPQTAYLAAYQEATGTRFAGHAEYSGTNRKKGAMINYYVNYTSEQRKTLAKKDSTSANKTKDSIYFKIYKDTSVIRTLKKKLPKENGFYRLYWSLMEKAAPGASRTVIKNANEKDGVLVVPGDYKVVMQFNKNKDSAMVAVKNDPRFTLDRDFIGQQYEQLKKITQYKTVLSEAVAQLAQSKKTANHYKRELNQQDKEKYKDQIKKSGAVIKKIDSLFDIYLGKEDKRQGITRNKDPFVLQRLNVAQDYAQARKNQITNTETLLTGQAHKALNEAIKKTNNFYENEWKAYKEEMNAIKLSHFTKTKTFNLE